MYLKKYDLSKVNDETFLNLFETITGKRPLTYSINKKDKSYIYIIDSDSDIELYITNAGCFSLYDRNLGEELEMELNQQKVGHILLETQWINPKVELPKDENEKVIIKYSDDDNIFIITGFLWKTNKIYFAVGSAEDELFNTEYDKMDIIGWIPAENMIM